MEYAEFISYPMFDLVYGQDYINLSTINVIFQFV